LLKAATKRRSGVLLPLAFLLPAFGQVPTFEAGLALYRAGHYSEAIENFNGLRNRGYTTQVLDFYQGVCLAKLGDLPAASRLLTTYVSARSVDPHGWYWLSRVQLLQKNFSDARTSAMRAIELDPNSSESYRTLGDVELELTNNDAAYHAWITANKLNPLDVQTTYHLGRLFVEANFFDEAAVWLQETLRLVPGHFSAMTYLGMCAEYLGDTSTAIKLYRKAIQESKSQQTPFALAYVFNAKLLRQMGMESEALAVLEESEKLCPDARAFSLLGQLLMAAHQSIRAEEVLRRAIQLDPQFPEVHYRLSLLLRSQNKPVEAQSEMTHFTRLKEMEKRTKNEISVVRVPAQARD
jgi:tetratricopeptide (TPR) repeat protein